MTILTHLTEERPSDSAIAALEEKFEAPFPEDYKAFLKRDNGGRPRERLFYMATRNGGTEEGVIDYFFALHSGRIGSLERAVNAYDLPAGSLPIATDSFGNLLVLKVGGPNPGEVCFWDHEQEEDGPASARLVRIAGSFSEFVAGLAVEGKKRA